MIVTQSSARHLLCTLLPYSVATFIAAAATVAPAAAQTPCETIQYRFVDPRATPGLARYRNRRTGESLALEDSIVLDAKDIDRVAAVAHRVGRDTVWSVIATLTPAAAQAFAATTANHTGDTMAVRIGDEIVDTGIIESRLGAKAGIVTGVSKAAADSMLTRV